MLQNLIHIWKMYSNVKKVILIIIISLISTVSLFAEEKSNVSLRFSRHENNIRIVLESDKYTIANADTISTLSNIKIAFPSRFLLEKQEGFFFDMMEVGRFLIIDLEDISDVKVYKLSTPPRLVIDLTSSGNPMLKGGQPALKTNVVDALTIDAGHGGYDYGIVSDRTKEKDLSLKLARDLGRALSGKGKKVFFTRNVDRASSIDSRIKFSYGKRADIFVSIHSSFTGKCRIYISSTNDMDADAIVTLYRQSSRQNRYIEKSRDLAYNIGESIKKGLEVDVVLKELPLPILNSMDTPAVLIEYPSPQYHEYNKKTRAAFVAAIMEGIAAYENGITAYEK